MSGDWKAIRLLSPLGHLTAYELSGVCIAGGAVLAVLSGVEDTPSHRESDVDIFFHGIEAKYLRQKAESVLGGLMRGFAAMNQYLKKLGEKEVKVIVIRSLYTISLFSSVLPTIQIVLASRKTLSAVVDAFDLDAASLAFAGPGQPVLAAPRAHRLLAFAKDGNAVQLIDPIRLKSVDDASGRIESRRMLKYASRNYSVAISPDLAKACGLTAESVQKLTKAAKAAGEKAAKESSSAVWALTGLAFYYGIAALNDKEQDELRKKGEKSAEPILAKIMARAKKLKRSEDDFMDFGTDPAMAELYAQHASQTSYLYLRIDRDAFSGRDIPALASKIVEHEKRATAAATALLKHEGATKPAVVFRTVFGSMTSLKVVQGLDYSSAGVPKDAGLLQGVAKMPMTLYIALSELLNAALPEMETSVDKTASKLFGLGRSRKKQSKGAATADKASEVLSIVHESPEYVYAKVTLACHLSFSGISKDLEVARRILIAALDITLSHAVALDRLEKKDDKNKIIKQLDEAVGSLQTKFDTALIDARTTPQDAVFEIGKVDDTAQRFLMQYLRNEPMV